MPKVTEDEKSGGARAVIAADFDAGGCREGAKRDVASNHLDTQRPDLNKQHVTTTQRSSYTDQ